MLYILKIELILLVSIDKLRNLIDYFSLFLEEEFNLNIYLYILSYICDNNDVILYNSLYL